MATRPAGKTPARPRATGAVRGPRAAGRRDAEATRRRILEAATAEFARGGFAGARVERISRSAASFDRMLYYHFGNKAELFGAVVEETYRRLWQAEEALELSQTEPERGMRELVAFTWHYFVDHPEFIRLLNSENLQGGANVKKSRGIARLSSPFIRTLTDLLQRGARAGTFRRGLDPVLVYITIAALAYFYAANQHTLSHFLNRELMAPAERKRWLAHITGVVLASLRPHPGGARTKPIAQTLTKAPRKRLNRP